MEAVYGDLRVKLSSGPNKPNDQPSDAFADIITPRGHIHIALEGDSGPVSKARIVRLAPSIYPQVVFERPTGGNACCVRTSIAFFDKRRWHALPSFDLVSPEGGYSIEDLNGDGSGALLFTYNFSGFEAHPHDYASPPRIQILREGQLVDVTSNPRYRSYLRKEMPSIATDPSTKTNDGEPFNYSIVAAWMAGKALTGETREGWSFVRTHYAKVYHESYICIVPNKGDICPANKVKPMLFLGALRTDLLNMGIVKDKALLPMPK